MRLFTLIAFLLFSGFAVAQAPEKTVPVERPPCCTFVIDHIAANGDLVSTVWDPNPVNAKTKSGKVQIEVLGPKKQVIKGWSTCTLAQCPAVSWTGAVGKPKQHERRNRKQVLKQDLAPSTTVIDLTSFGPGQYLIRATGEHEVLEKTVTIPANGLTVPYADKKAVGGQR